MKIYHILVEQGYEAEDIVRKIKAGSDFKELAKKYSKCSSASRGGDLGDLSRKLDRLDENFREACEILKIGDISSPVRTKFGYHLIFRTE